MRGDRRCDLTDERDLLVTQNAGSFDQRDGRMGWPRARELVEVIAVRRHEHAIFLRNALESGVGHAEDPAVAHVVRVDAISDQRDRGGRGDQRQVLIE